MNNIVKNIRLELKGIGKDPDKRKNQHAFKEKIICYGVKTPVVMAISKKYLPDLKIFSKQELFNLCDELWQSGFIEEALLACKWSHLVYKKFEPADFKIFEKWISKYVTNWATCDTLCNHTIGDFVTMFPEYLEELKKWTKSDNRWFRRAAAVSLIVPAKRGNFLNDVFDIADLLLIDTDDMVQKGYGWMLKSASHSHQKEVFDFVMKNKENMPRTALRYAIEKMPDELMVLAMKK